MKSNDSPSAPNPFSTALLHWYGMYRRPLPWRDTRDAYAIWLSEIILQQTRVEQGQPYWERFMSRWPTVEQLASATEDEVLREWQGLGYYSRGRNLLAAARQVVELGGFPQAMEGLRALRGVGDYTAAAIGSMAFGLHEAVVDGNVYRLLARYFGIDTPVGTARAKHEFTALAQALLPRGQAAEWNQAAMDFGATMCTPRNARCIECPLAETCAAFRQGRVGELPVKQRKQKATERHLIYIYIRCKGQTALHRRGPGDIWQGLWEPLLIEDGGLPQLDGRLMLLRQGVRHVLTHRVLLADLYLLETERCPALPPGYVWIAEQDIDRYGVPRLVELLLEALPKFPTLDAKSSASYV